jgi:hypothetical protein
MPIAIGIVSLQSISNVKTWYKLRGKEIEKRKGLLIHNKPFKAKDTD